MCDYCGCRHEGPTAELHREHLRLIELRDELSAAVPGEQVDDRFEELVDLLQRHAVKEEIGLFVQARTIDELVDRLDTLCAEHERLHRDLSAGFHGPGRHEAFELLGTHIDDEEWDLFPHVFPILGPEQWDEIALAHLAVDEVWEGPDRASEVS